MKIEVEDAREVERSPVLYCTQILAESLFQIMGYKSRG